MNTTQYLALLRTKFPKAKTTYAMAKLLNVSHTTASRYDKGLGSFDEPIARRVAELLDLPHAGIVLLDMQKERAQSEESRNLWSEIAEGFQEPLQHANSGLRVALTR